jgi:surface adhesion protein
VNGAEGPNLIYGTSGDDSLTGGNESDEILGREGNDILIGGGGDDILVGGYGSETLNGGAGADTFVFRMLDEGVDTIADYSEADADAIDIADLLTGYTAGDDISSFVSVATDGVDTMVSVSPDGVAPFTDIAVLSGITSGTVTVIVDQNSTAESVIVA